MLCLAPLHYPRFRAGFYTLLQLRPAPVILTDIQDAKKTNYRDERRKNHLIVLDKDIGNHRRHRADDEPVKTPFFPHKNADGTSYCPNTEDNLHRDDPGIIVPGVLTYGDNSHDG